MIFRLFLGMFVAMSAAFLVADLLLYGAEAVESLSQPQRTPLLFAIIEQSQGVADVAQNVLNTAKVTVQNLR